MSFFSMNPRDLHRESHWTPSADVYRTPKGWVIKLDLAGVRPEDLSVSCAGRRLIVRGVRRDWLIESGWSHHSMEIEYSRFERSLELPCDLEQAQVESQYRQGMLLIFVLTEARI